MKETRKFKISPNMIFHTIHSQAGSIEKAILECLMNAVDAGATQVDVEFDENGIDYLIKDNGKGFATRDEILACFEVFGFDHGTPEENKRTYGTFGIGRAQLWAFSKNIWKTNAFVLDVDIKNKGLDYELSEVKKDNVKGCHIMGKFYEKQSLSDIQSAIRELTKLALYLPIPFTLNGKVVNKTNESVKWDHENENAYVKFNETGDLNVYNKGVFVKAYGNHRFGKGGTINSKVALTLNTARNDILLSHCKVWKSISKYISDKAEKSNLAKAQLTPDQAKNLINKWIDGSLKFSEICDKKMFPDAKGKLNTINAFLKFKQFTVAPHKHSQVGENIQSKQLAFVFSPEILDWLDVEGAQLSILINQALERHYYTQRATYVPFEKLQSTLNTSFEILEKKKITKRDMVFVDVLEKISYNVCKLVNRKNNDTKITTRKVLIGESKMALAWTDGKTYIAFDHSFVKDNMSSGLGGILKIITVMIHEYVHSETTSEDHVHSHDFYETFHDILTDHASEICTIQKECAQKCASQLMKAGFAIPKTHQSEERNLDESLRAS